MNVKKSVIIAVSAVIVIVLFQNTQVVSLRFLFWQVSMSQIILLPVILAVGIGAGYFLGRRRGE
jgi:uncharacterized integral membrane protein